MRCWGQKVSLFGLALAITACGKSESSDGRSSRRHGAALGTRCLGADESQNDGFHNYALHEVVIQERDTFCDSKTCLINHFQGRVSCPYGQTEAEATTSPRCFLPGSDEPVSLAVEPQLLARASDETVTCSCRCAGPVGPFCDCPVGMVCENLVREIGNPPPPDGGVMAASYCIPEGATYDPAHPPAPDVCDAASGNCGDARPYPPP